MGTAVGQQHPAPLIYKSLYATRMPPTQHILSVHLRSASSSRDAILSTLLYRDTLGGSPPPTPPPGTHPHPTPTPHPTPPTPRAQGGQGPQRAHGGLWGYSEAIPNGKPFQMDGNFEWKGLKGPWGPYEDRFNIGNIGNMRYQAFEK